MDKYENMTIEALEAEKKQLELQRDTIRDEMLKIVAAINLKIAEGKVAAMTESERASLAKVIGKK